jgi:putative ABC transport system permease protein
MSALRAARLVRRGATQSRGVSILLAALVLCATLLAVAMPRAVDRTLTDALHSDLAAAGNGRLAFNAFLASDTAFDQANGDFSIVPVWSSIPSALAEARGRLASLGGIVEPGAYLGQALGEGGAGFPGGGTPTAASNARFSFGLEAVPALRDDARLVDGRWPRAVRNDASIEVVMAAASASSMKWRIGQTQTLSLPEPRQVTLVGTVAPRDPASAFWALDPHRATAGMQPSSDGTFVTYRGTLWVDAASWPRLATSLTGHQIEAWLPVDTTRIDTAEATSVASTVRRFVVQTQPLNVAGSDAALSFRTDLPSELTDFTARSAPSTAMITLFAIGPAGAFGAVLLLGLRLLARRRSTAALLVRARGGSGWQGRLIAFGEVLLWTAPAAVLGGVVGVALTPDVGSPAAAIPAVVLCVLAAPVAAAALGGVDDAAEDSGRLAATLRYAAEGVIVLLAALALALLFTRGPVESGAAADPVLLAAPLLLGLAVTVVVVRIAPLVSTRLARFERRGDGPVGLVSASATARGGGGIWTLFALLVGVGMAVFSLTLVGTQQHGVQQAAVARTGSDVAVRASALTAQQVQRIAAIPGVAAHATIEVLGQQPVGSVPATISGVDVADLAAVQTGLDRSALAGVAGTSALVAGLDSPPRSISLSPIGHGTLSLRPVDPEVVSEVFTQPQWVLLDQREVSKAEGIPTGMLLRLRPGADSARVARAAAELAPLATVTTAEQSERAFLGTPLDAAVQASILIAAALSALLVLAVFAVSLAAEAAERLRRGAILRALGFDRRQTAVLVLRGIAPTAVAGVVAGTPTGIALAAAVLRSLDPAGLVGSPVPPALVIDPVATMLAALGFLASAALAGLVAIVLDARRPPTAGLHTLGEER